VRLPLAMPSEGMSASASVQRLRLVLGRILPRRLGEALDPLQARVIPETVRRRARSCLAEDSIRVDEVALVRFS